MDKIINAPFLLGSAKETQYKERTNWDTNGHQRGSQEYSHGDEKEAISTTGPSANAEKAENIDYHLRGDERFSAAKSHRKLKVSRVAVVRFHRFSRSNDVRETGKASNARSSWGTIVKWFETNSWSKTYWFSTVLEVSGLN